MKKLMLLIGMFLMILGVTFASSAMCSPDYPVFGKATTGNIVEATNGVDTVSTTAANGMWVLSLGNFANCYKQGDIITVTSCLGPECEQSTFTLSGDFHEVDFTVGEEPEPEPEPTPEVVDQVTSNIGDTIASIDVFYGQEFTMAIGDSKLGKLLDTEIDFDGKDYDVEETITLTGRILTSLDDTDFEDAPFLNINEGEIVYKFIFNDPITLADITEDDSLEIVFLGEDIEITDASATRITMISGEDKTLKLNEEYLGVKVIAFGDNEVLFNDGTESVIIREGDVNTIGNLEIYVKNVLNNDLGDVVDIKIGADVLVTVEDGEDYEDGEVWRWVIDMPNFIGITNQQDYRYLDDDEEFKPLSLGSAITLPNDFTNIQFSRLSDFDEVQLSFKVKGDYLYVTSLDEVFSFGTDDYDRLYIDANGIYDKDKELITTDKVRILDGENYLEMGSVKIGDLTIKLDMSDILYKGKSFAGRDDIFLGYTGIIFDDPKNGVEDQSGFKVYVPDERPEVTITVGALTKIGVPIDCPITTCPTTTCPELIIKDCEPTIIYEEKIVEVEKDCPTCPEPTDDGVSGWVAVITAILGGGAVYFFKRREAEGKTLYGVGIKTYVGRDGTVKTFHKHPGTRGYHDPDNQHSPTTERHIKGQLNPKYEKDDKGLWNYID